MNDITRSLDRFGELMRRHPILSVLIGAVVVAALGVVASVAGGHSGPGVSQYYSEGYSAAQSSPYNKVEDDTLAGNAYCTNLWNQYINGTGQAASLEGQAIEDYDSGWVADCESAPYGQSGIDVPGSGVKPASPSEGY